MAGHTFAAIVLDIDLLIRRNADHGHEVGDAALRAVAAELARSKGIVARIEGDAFAILLEDRSQADAVAVAERYRGFLADLALAPHGKIPLTASFGVAGWQPGDSLETLIARAQHALAAAKERGGNCVVAANGAAPGRSAAS